MREVDTVDASTAVTKTSARRRADEIKAFRCKNLIAVIENPTDIRNIGTVIRNVNALGDMCVCIPMFGMIESLNLGTSSGIVLYEIAKQRREYQGKYRRRGQRGARAEPLPTVLAPKSP